MAYHQEKRIVRLLDPSMCTGVNDWANDDGTPNPCRFCRMAKTKDNWGGVEQMIHCQRMDCDNWDYVSFNNGHSAEIIE